VELFFCAGGPKEKGKNFDKRKRYIEASWTGEKKEGRIWKKGKDDTNCEAPMRSYANHDKKKKRSTTCNNGRNMGIGGGRGGACRVISDGDKRKNEVTRKGPLITGTGQEGVKYTTKKMGDK